MKKYTTYITEIDLGVADQDYIRHRLIRRFFSVLRKLGTAMYMEYNRSSNKYEIRFFDEKLEDEVQLLAKSIVKNTERLETLASDLLILGVNIEIIIQFPRDLYSAISIKRQQRLEQNRNPNLLVLWTGYKMFFDDIINSYGAYGRIINKDIPLKFMGLNVWWTDIPDTIEVF